MGDAGRGGAQDDRFGGAQLYRRACVTNRISQALSSPRHSSDLHQRIHAIFRLSYAHCRSFFPPPLYVPLNHRTCAGKLKQCWYRFFFIFLFLYVNAASHERTCPCTALEIPRIMMPLSELQPTFFPKQRMRKCVSMTGTTE